MSKAFKGFPKPTSNYFTVPNIMLDEFSEITSLAEIKVILYLIRHTWGYHEYGKPKPITTDEFMNGRKRKDGSRIDKGTGLKSNKSVIEGLKLAEEHGFIVSEIDDTDRARIVKAYALKMYDEEPEEEPARCVESTQPRRVDSTHRYVDATHQRVDSTQRTEKHTLGKPLIENNRETHLRPASSKTPTSSKPQENVCVSSSFSNSFSQKETPIRVRTGNPRPTNDQAPTQDEFHSHCANLHDDDTKQQKTPFTDLELAIIATWEKDRGFPLNRNAGKFREQLTFVVSLMDQHLMTLEDIPALIKKAENDNYTRQQKTGLSFALFAHLLSLRTHWFTSVSQEPEGSQDDEFMACLMEKLIESQPEESA